MPALWPIAIGLLLCLVREPGVEAMQRATPEEVNLRSEVLQGIQADVQELVRKHIVPGGIVKVARHGKLVYESTVGYPSDDMIFRLFSMSKPVTAAAVCLLVQEGLIELDDPVGKHIPELANLEVIRGQFARPGWYDTEPPRTLPTVRHLLTHTAGFTYGHGNTTVDALYRRANLISYINKGETLAELVAAVASLPLLYHPGEHWWYSLSFDIAGYLIEKVTGQPVDVYMRDHLFEPLGMVDTGFWVPPEKAHRLSTWALMSGDPESASRTFPDWNMIGNNFLEDPTLKLAGGGLVSTANDFLNFAQMLLNGGTLDGKRILRADLVEQLVTNQLPKHLMPYRMLGVTYYNQGHTLGSASQLLDTDEGPAGEVTWGGQANTKWFISRRFNTVIIAMTQKSPFPFQVADVARHYVYRSATDVPAPRNDTNLVDDKGERIDMWEVLPHGSYFNPHWQEASTVRTMSGRGESDDAPPRVRSYERA